MNDEKKLLIVEDEDAIARALKLKLSNAGFTVSVAKDGEDGIEQAESEEPDLVITDLVMPKKNGFELIEALNSEDTPVFVLSNLSQKDDKERAKKLGAEKFFVKSDTQVAEVVEYIKDYFSS